MSYNPWCIFLAFCCVGPILFGAVALRLGISIGRRGMPSLQSPLRFGGGRYASPEPPAARENVLEQVRRQQGRRDA
jgi:hypothetical protein